MEKAKMALSTTNQPRLQALVFAAKASLHRFRRTLFQATAPRLEKRPRPVARPFAAESRTPLRSSSHHAEQRLQEGKIRNLAVASQFLHSLRIPAGEIFSFWRHVARPTRRAGFTEGRELREGCIIPSVGGGLCQLSNALYAVALDAGCEIIERHAHTRIIPGSAASDGRDATVFWNYVDFRFRPRHELWLEVLLTDDDLVVRLLGKSAPSPGIPELPASTATGTAQSCETCGAGSCFRHRALHGAGNAPPGD
jgi:vancomycin resistance protein VanW